MKLNKRELEVLDALVEGESCLSDLASAMKMKKPNLVRCLKKLRAYGLASTVRKGRVKYASISTDLAFAFSNLKAVFPALNLSEILYGKVPSILAFLKDAREFRLADLDMPAVTAKRILSKLRSAGVVSMPKRGDYLLRPESVAVADFCRNALMRIIATEAEKELGQIWYSIYSFNSATNVEAVFVTKRQSKSGHYWPTAYSAFAAHGVQIIQAGKFYYSNVKPTLGGIIIHTLAISRDARSISYAALLALKNNYDASLLLKKKQAFGLGRDYIAGFIDFIKSKGNKTFQGVSFRELEEMGYGKL